MFALWSNIRVSVRSELPGWVAGGVHPSIMAPQGSSPIKSGNWGMDPDKNAHGAGPVSLKGGLNYCTKNRVDP